MSENKKFGNLDIIYNDSTKFYKEVLDYINENDIKSYGIVVIGTPNEILKLRENAIVEYIYIEDVKLSLDTK